MTKRRICLDDISRQFLNMAFDKIPGNKNENISPIRNEMRILFAKEIMADYSRFYWEMFNVVKV